MRIALVILRAEAGRGGAERYTVDLAGALAGRGHEVTLISASLMRTAEVGAASDRPGVSHVQLPARAVTRLGSYERFLDSLDRHLDTRPYDIIHAMLPVRRCHVYHPHAGVAEEAIVRGHEKHRSPLARGISGLFNRLNRKRRRFADVERELLTGKRPPLVLCLSQYIRHAVQSHYSLPDGQLPTLFNAVDLDWFGAHFPAAPALRKQLGLGDQQIVALMVAQDFERKGLREAMAALARCPDARLVLVVVGKPSAAPYRRLARSLGVEHRVIFAGPTSDPRPFYREADFFVLPTRHDPCSLVVLEALAMGLPVISTVQNGACEIMVDGQHGRVLSDPSDVDGLAAAMGALLDPALRNTMRRNCLALRPQLSRERHLDTLLEIYSRVQK